MRQIVLNVPDRDYALVAKCAFVEDPSVEKLAWIAIRDRCGCDLCESIASLLNLDDRENCANIWSPDIEKIMKGEGVA